MEREDRRGKGGMEDERGMRQKRRWERRRKSRERRGHNVQYLV